MSDPSVVCDLYARVSTTEQAEEGFSLAEQEKRLRAFAESQGWRINAFYSDPGFSGAKLERPGIQAVMRDAEARRINAVVTYKLDRLSRSQKDTLFLIEDVFRPNGVSYISMTESFNSGTPFGQAMLGLLAVFAQLEREQIRERMTMGKLAAARLGRWQSPNAPTGYRYIPKDQNGPGRLVVDPYEAAFVRRVFGLFLERNSINAIKTKALAEFPELEKSSHSGSHWISDILSNRIYIGAMSYKGEWYETGVERIIEPETFFLVQSRLSEYREQFRNSTRPYKSADHLLSGLLFCGECGARFRYMAQTTKTGGKTEYYACKTRHSGGRLPSGEKCSTPFMRVEALEAVIWDQVEALRFEDLDQPGPDGPGPEITRIEEELRSVDAKLDRLVDLYALGSIPLSSIEKRSADLNRRRSELEDRLEALRLDAPEDLSRIRSALEQISEIRTNGSLEDQRQLLRLLIDRITISPDRSVRIDWRF